MATLMLGINEQDRELLHDMCKAVYFDGECYVFALALHEGLGWPMVGLIAPSGAIRHVVLSDPKGDYFDARGHVSAKEAGAPFGFRYMYNSRRVEADELLRKGEPLESQRRGIIMARRFAEALWPNLPWKNTFAGRMRMFMSELEQLSRKHGVWIRSAYPTTRPVLIEQSGDEGGYDVSTSDGRTYTFDRYFGR